MINGIMKTPMIRNFAIGAMFAGSAVAAQAANPVTIPQERGPQQEQVMSREAASALLSVVFSQAPSYERNENIDKKFLACAKPNVLGMENKAGVEYSYRNFGTAYTVMNLQTAICESYFDKTLEGFQKSEKKALARQLENPTVEQSNEYLESKLISSSLGDGGSIVDYYNNKLETEVKNFSKYYHETWIPFRDSFLMKALEKGQGKPSAKICSETMDELMAAIPFFSDEERKEYTDDVKKYENDLSSSAVDQSNLIAYKLFKIDSLIIKRNAKEFKMLNNSRLENEFFINYDMFAQPQSPATPEFGLG